MTTSRIIHGLGLAVILAFIVLTFFAAPELWNDRTTSFATFGGFATFYGVVFAAIETARARSASQLALISAQSASADITRLFDIKSIDECQHHIKTLIADLEKHKWASPSALARVIELYTHEFHAEYINPASDERAAVLQLRSLAAAAVGQVTQKNLKPLKEVLMGMLADLAAAGSSKITEREK